MGAEQHGVLGADGVEDAAHVLHTRLEGGKLTAVIGKPDAPLVEEDESE